MVLLMLVAHVMSRYVRVGAILPSGRLFRTSDDVVKSLVRAEQAIARLNAKSCAWMNWVWVWVWV